MSDPLELARAKRDAARQVADAAPAMLEALRTIELMSRDAREGTERMARVALWTIAQIAEEAITKATGE